MRKNQPPSSPQHFFTLLSEIEPGRLRKIHQYNGELHNFSASDQLKKGLFPERQIHLREIRYYPCGIWQIRPNL